MPFKVTVQGVGIECDSAMEAMALVRLASIKSATSTRRRPGRPPKNGHTAIRENKEEQGVAATLCFLRTVEANPNGANKNAVMLALELTDGRAIGGTIVRAISVLGKRGLEPKKVFRTRKGGPNGTVWKAGPALSDAIARLEQSEDDR